MEKDSKDGNLSISEPVSRYLLSCQTVLRISVAGVFQPGGKLNGGGEKDSPLSVALALFG
jgi:hypothetical protein